MGVRGVGGARLVRRVVRAFSADVADTGDGLATSKTEVLHAALFPNFGSHLGGVRARGGGRIGSSARAGLPGCRVEGEVL